MPHQPSPSQSSKTWHPTASSIFVLSKSKTSFINKKSSLLHTFAFFNSPASKGAVEVGFPSSPSSALYGSGSRKRFVKRFTRVMYSCTDSVSCGDKTSSFFLRQSLQKRRIMLFF
eukprot:GDKK01032155.1.p1 GENE.GDKK01032155.1~~GDKK01032155.1.p1  ORF type:complete len:115 (+),score=20.53 GDKK01032155.1:25-369(+)